ncbi:hypothetical protein KC19_11G153000 [Ceratodon purpureus]|uniref:Uncharacterized protein n=1 Tax=Ceratodon purpureus TaxID=3225 RepID=A0A8T0GHG3_CERPU|nr:hypothetical protein KC19_11G153000 [Ceratodon purpureus]
MVMERKRGAWKQLDGGWVGNAVAIGGSSGAGEPELEGGRWKLRDQIHRHRGKEKCAGLHCHSVASRLLFCGSGFRHPHHHTTSTSTEDCNSTPHRAHTTWVHFWYSFQQFSTVSNSFRIVWNSFGIVWNSWLDSGVSGLTV